MFVNRLGAYFTGGATAAAALAALTAPSAGAEPPFCTGEFLNGENCVNARVTGPVDVYNAVNYPAGAATKIGQLNDGDLVVVWGDCGDLPDQVRMDRRISPPVLIRNKWCHIKGDPVPTGQGYIRGHLVPQYSCRFGVPDGNCF